MFALRDLAAGELISREPLTVQVAKIEGLDWADPQAIYEAFLNLSSDQRESFLQLTPDSVRHIQMPRVALSRDSSSLSRTRH